MRRLECGAGRRHGAEIRLRLRRTMRGKSSSRLVRRPRRRLATGNSGGVGAPPGGTTASCQELADADRGSFAGPMLALEWADTVHRQGS